MGVGDSRTWDGDGQVPGSLAACMAKRGMRWFDYRTALWVASVGFAAASVCHVLLEWQGPLWYEARLLALLVAAVGLATAVWRSPVLAGRPARTDAWLVRANPWAAALHLVLWEVPFLDFL